MKKLIFSTFVILVICTSLAFSQTQMADYNKVDYLEVENNLQVAETVTQSLTKAYQQLVDSGEVKSWRLYRVQYPGGERSNYNYVSIATVSDIKTIEGSLSGKTMHSYVPESNQDSLNLEMMGTTQLVASEIWKIRSMLSEDSVASNPSKYMTMDYMNVPEGEGPSYLTLEDEVAKPLHMQRAQEGRMADWQVYSLVLPGGTQYGYNYATGNFFDSLKDIEFGFSRELIRQTLPDRDVRELLDTIYETRDLVKSELWELVSHTE